MKPLSIYFHIPFCLRRCGYCDFYSTTDLARREAYACALLREIASAPIADCTAVTVYFGGGTPSLLGEALCDILDALRERLPLAPDCEITLEANPATITPKLLSEWLRAGFNRISFGLQACDDRSLAALGRLHSVSDGEKAVAQARLAGFRNISGDIMLATPAQDTAGAVRLAEYAASLSLPHISAYLLKIEPNTPFDKQNISAICPSPDAAAEIYLAASETLEARGYRHYEISNFALAGCESRHNCVYWTLGEYYGMGAAAYSFLGGRRFHHPADIARYISTENPASDIVSDGEGGGADEYLMLALRLAQGVSLEEASRRGMDTSALLRRARPLERNGLLRIGGDSISLTNRGFLLSNSIITALAE